jgi:thiosulfate reductase cytochrome b subunit
MASKPENMQVQLVAKHSLTTRWFHWLNFPLLAVMVWSGMLIYWAHDAYRIGWGSWTLFKLFPPGWYKFLGWEGRLAEGMAWHFFFGWLFAINGLCYVLYLVLSGRWREFWPSRGDVRDAWQVVLHDLGIRKAPLPEAKFNPAQKLTYFGVILMGLGSLLTGLAIYKPVQLQWLTMLFGGYQPARFIHFWLTILFCLFFLVHVFQVLRAGWRTLRAMVTGFDIMEIRKGDG